MSHSQFGEKIIARAWKDPAFKKKLLTNSREALKEMGVNVPSNVNVKVIEDSANTYTFVLPASPANAKNLSEAELENIAGADPAPTGVFAPLI